MTFNGFCHITTKLATDFVSIFNSSCSKYKDNMEATSCGVKMKMKGCTAFVQLLFLQFSLSVKDHSNTETVPH